MKIKPKKKTPKPKRTKPKIGRGTASSSVGRKATKARRRPVRTKTRIPKGLRYIVRRRTLGGAEGFFPDLEQYYVDAKEALGRHYDTAKERLGQHYDEGKESLRKFYEENEDAIDLAAKIALGTVGVGALGYGAHRLLQDQETVDKLKRFAGLLPAVPRVAGYVQSVLSDSAQPTHPLPRSSYSLQPPPSAVAEGHETDDDVPRTATVQATQTLAERNRHVQELMKREQLRQAIAARAAETGRSLTSADVEEIRRNLSLPLSARDRSGAVLRQRELERLASREEAVRLLERNANRQAAEDMEMQIRAHALAEGDVKRKQASQARLDRVATIFNERQQQKPEASRKTMPKAGNVMGALLVGATKREGNRLGSSIPYTNTPTGQALLEMQRREAKESADAFHRQALAAQQARTVTWEAKLAAERKAEEEARQRQLLQRESDRRVMQQIYNQPHDPAPYDPKRAKEFDEYNNAERRRLDALSAAAAEREEWYRQRKKEQEDFEATL